VDETTDHQEDIAMRITIAAITTLTLLAASPSFADKSSKEENIGVGSGALIGAAAGGPVGFIIGAAIGGKIGDSFHHKNETIDTLNGSLGASRGDVAELEGSVRELNGNVDSLSAELERMREVDRPELVKLLRAGIDMDLLFRTDEHVLADTTGARLAELADSLAAMPGIRIQLDGYADERGDADYNRLLSEERAQFVRDQLVAAGVDPSRIRVAAHGEAVAQDANPDSYALERRVSVKLFIDDAPAVASNPE
jgi:outer membrane protein OmpA-like peptidoglycan-associated protein